MIHLYILIAKSCSQDKSVVLCDLRVAGALYNAHGQVGPARQLSRIGEQEASCELPLHIERQICRGKLLGQVISSIIKRPVSLDRPYRSSNAVSIFSLIPAIPADSATSACASI